MIANGFQKKLLFSPDEIDVFKQTISEQIDRVATALSAPFEYSEPGLSIFERLETLAKKDPSYATIMYHAICGDLQRDPRIHQLITHSKLRLSAEELIGQKIETGTVRVRCNIPSLENARQRWHSDVVLMNGQNCSKIKVACWIPLQDVDNDNGTMEIVHQSFNSPFPHTEENGQFIIPEESLQQFQKETIIASAGNCVFIDRFTPHQSIPNKSPYVRWSIVVWFRTA